MREDGAPSACSFLPPGAGPEVEPMVRYTGFPKIRGTFQGGYRDYIRLYRDYIGF